MNNIKLKLILLGDTYTGKTSLLNCIYNNDTRYDNDISNTYISTIGVDFRKKTITKKNNYKQLELQLEYDYILYKYGFEDKIYTIILSNIDNFNENKLITICNFQFIYVSIKTDDKTIDITNILKNNENYFYITDSILFNDVFMLWIFNYKLNIYLDNYKIYIIDHNLNNIILNKNEYIKLNNNNYDVINI